MKFDDILKAIGEFGPHQIKVYTLVNLIAVFVAANQMVHVFLSAQSDHWCEVPVWTDEYESCEDLLGNDAEYLDCLYRYRNASIPLETEDGETSYSQCLQYDTVYPEWEEGFSAGNGTNMTKECEAWVYDKREYTRTIRTDFDLVCDKKAAADLSQSAWFVGVLVGSLVFGQLSDVIGRFYTFYIAVTGLFILTTAAAFMPNYWSFTLVRSTAGMFNMGCYLLAFVLGTELVGPSKRVLAGIIIQFIFAVGYMILAVLAYFIRDWRVLQLVVAAPICLFFLTIPFVSESARWLISKQRYDEAEAIIRKAAKGNKAEEKLPENFMKQLKETEEAKSGNNQSATMLDLFRTPRLRLMTMNLMYNWFINSLVYYGLSLSTSDLGSNDFVAFFISGAVEVPAYIICIPAIESRLGRKYCTIGFELLGGVACLLTVFFPLGTARTTVAMIGKFAISASFAIVYIYSAEIFPTPVRTAGMGICSMFARVSGILAPMILLLDEYWEPLPLVIFGSTCIVGGLLVFFLPETRGMKLPETLAEGEAGSQLEVKDPIPSVSSDVSSLEEGRVSNTGFKDAIPSLNGDVSSVGEGGVSNTGFEDDEGDKNMEDDVIVSSDPERASGYDDTSSLGK